MSRCCIACLDCAGRERSLSMSELDVSVCGLRSRCRGPRWDSDGQRVQQGLTRVALEGMAEQAARSPSWSLRLSLITVTSLFRYPLAFVEGTLLLVSLFLSFAVFALVLLMLGGFCSLVDY